MPELVTIPNVPLVETGVDWPASTGPVTFTPDDLYAAADAAINDPAIKLPRLRFGHTDAGTSMQDSAAGFSEQPCVGKFKNLRVENDGNLLVADLVGVPKWLAEILPTAYPNRSVEAFFEVTTNTGKEHRMVITSVAMLGEHLPGVQTLDDLEYLFSDQPTEWIEALTAKTTVMAQHEGGDPTMPKRVAASVDSSDVRSEFYSQVAVDDRYWWWLHQMYLDPQAVIAEDESMGYWYVPYTVDGNSVEFGEPVQVFIQWVEEESGKVAAKASKLPKFGKPEKSYASAAESRPADRQREFINKSTAKEASAAVPKINMSALRKRLNLSEAELPDDADEDTINKALEADANEPDDTDETEDDTSPAPEGDDAVSVDAQAYRDQQARLAALEKKEAAREQAAQAAEVDQAVKDRKIPPARKAHYLGLMKRDPEGTREFLGKLEKNAVPGPEIGTSRGADEDGGNKLQGTGLLPELETAGKEG